MTDVPRLVTRALLPVLLLWALSGCVRRVVTVDAAALSPDEPPAGAVDVSVVSDNARQQWDVYAGSGVVCSTPCTRRFAVSDRLLLESRNGHQVQVPSLDVGSLRAMVIAEGTHRGLQVNGIVFTTLGGMGVVVAITLTAVGCSDLQRRPGTCTAGLITGAVTVPLTAVAIWMIAAAAPQAHVLPVFKTTAAKGQTPVTFVATPGGLIGTF